ncbi:MAG: hypothetical protein EBZ74_11260 [Planctomycetia bacterium]|nr:hypothetical protein [Planctomycetia bacterium]
MPPPSRCVVGGGVWLISFLLCTAALAAEPQPLPPRNSGPEAWAHSHVRQHRRKTVRVIRRTPAVMREDAARVKRGDLFSTWSNKYLE